MGPLSHVALSEFCPAVDSRTACSFHGFTVSLVELEGLM